MWATINEMETARKEYFQLEVEIASRAKSRESRNVAAWTVGFMTLLALLSIQADGLSGTPFWIIVGSLIFIVKTKDAYAPRDSDRGNKDELNAEYAKRASDLAIYYQALISLPKTPIVELEINAFLADVALSPARLTEIYERKLEESPRLKFELAKLNQRAREDR